MKMLRVTAALGYLLFLPTILLARPAPSRSASFDCAKAVTRTEKIICSDANISREDGRLARVYAETARKALNRPKLLEDQKTWLLRREDAPDAAALLALYRERIRWLESVPRADTLPFNGKDCTGFLRRNGIDNVAHCRVDETGDLGNTGGLTYYYALYCIIPNESASDSCQSPNRYHNVGMAIFRQKKGSQQKLLFLERVDSVIGGTRYETVSLVENSYGTLLELSIRLDGTGNINESEYYLWNARRSEWIALDAERWLTDLEKRLPPGMSIWKGVWPDIETMTAEAEFCCTKHDISCCPAGTALITLSLKGRRFHVQSVKIRKE